MRTKGTAAELEARRRLAAELLADGKTIVEVMHALHVSESSVKRWKSALREGGIEALAAKPHPGRPPRLKARQRKQLVRILLRGPIAAGYSTQLWTCSRVAAVIQQQWGVRYSTTQTWRLLKRLAWSPQKPSLRARERDEAAIERWRNVEWPRIKKERRAAS
jgi:transposase